MEEDKTELAMVLQRADQLLPAFRPRDLPLVHRSSDERLARIRESIAGPITQTILITAPGGYGKTVLLGEIYQDIRQSVPWVGLIRCTDFGVSDLRQTLAQEFGRGLLGRSSDVIDVANALTEAHGRGAILIDTLDRIVDPSIIPTIHDVFAGLVSRGVTVVVTCRDYEYAALLDPIADTMPRIAETFAWVKLPAFDEEQVQSAARSFLVQEGGSTQAQTSAFIARVLDLRYENHHLFELARIPLLLSMLCKLYGPQGFIPADLTVSSLWADYWERRVRKSGRHPVDLAESRSREEFCFNLAAALFNNSKRTLLQFTDDRTGPEQIPILVDMLSEGVVLQEGTTRLGFFHQTLLEYAIVLWMQTAGGSRAEAMLIAVSSKAQAAFVDQPHYYWPLLRQYTAVCDRARCDHLLEGLDWNNHSAVRAVVLGTMARRDLDILEAVSDRIQRDEGYHRLFLEAISTVDSSMIDMAWRLVLELIDRGRESNVDTAVEALAVLTERAGAKTIDLFREMIRRLSEKRFRARNRDINFLVARYLNRLSSSSALVPQSIVDELRVRYLDFSAGIQMKILEFHARPEMSDESRAELIVTALEAPAGRDQAPLLIQIGGQIKHHLPGVKILRDTMEQGWDSVWPAIIGLWAVQDQKVLEELIDGFLNCTAQVRHRFTLALMSAIEAGAASATLQRLMRRPIEMVDAHGARTKDIAELAEVWATHLSSPQEAEALRSYLAPLHYPNSLELLTARLALWSGNLDELNSRIIELNKLSDNQFRRLVQRLLYKMPREKLVAFSHRLLRCIRSRKPGLQDLAAALYAKLPEHFPEAVPILVQLATGPMDRVALAAARAIRTFAEDGRISSGRSISSLATAKFGGVQQHWAHSIAAVVMHHDLSNQEAAELSNVLKSKQTDLQATIIGTEALTRWIRRHRVVAQTVLEPALGFLKEHLQADALRIEDLKLSKAIAEFGPNECIGELSELTLRILETTDLGSINLAEHEMADLIRAIGRRLPTLLRSFAGRLDLGALPSRNIRAIAFAVRSLEGANSFVLSQIAMHPRVSEEVKSTVARLRF